MFKAGGKDLTNIFWTTILVAFVLLIHNGTEPAFILAYSLIPILAGLFYWKKSLWPLVIYLLIFGALGRYTRYFRENYASDTLLAIRDYIGYFLSGRNPYGEIIWANSGLTPFTYLPFSLFWYLPAQILAIDLRYFEMLVSMFVPVLVFLYGYIKKNWNILPLTAAIALTPFLLDLSSDGSNDNSAILLLLISIVSFIQSQKNKSKFWAVFSAVSLGAAATFKHHVLFYLIYFIPYLWTTRDKFSISKKKYLIIALCTILILILPFVFNSPYGFYKSQFFIEIGNYHPLWGWNIWVAMRDKFGLIFSKTLMWQVRTIVTLISIIALLCFGRFKSLNKVILASAMTMLIYLITSDWTTYAYFTFLLPLIAVGAITEEKN